MSLPENPTVIVVHHKERRSKCTVEPLRGEPGVEFWSYPLKEPRELPGYVRLGMEGPPLTREDREHGLLVLDATWKLADRMEADFADVPTRTLPVCRTAYPRNSKLYDDPSAGLATIEAIYVAYKILGYRTDNLLEQYYWKEQFLEINAETWKEIEASKAK